jgi:hypothetical protein
LRVASAISGPTPSPGRSVTLCIAFLCVSETLKITEAISVQGT